MLRPAPNKKLIKLDAPNAIVVDNRTDSTVPAILAKKLFFSYYKGIMLDNSLEKA